MSSGTTVPLSPTQNNFLRLLGLSSGSPFIAFFLNPSPPPTQWVDNQPTDPHVDDSLLQRRARTYMWKCQPAYTLKPLPQPPKTGGTGTGMGIPTSEVVESTLQTLRCVVYGNRMGDSGHLCLTEGSCRPWGQAFHSRQDHKPPLAVFTLPYSARTRHTPSGLTSTNEEVIQTTCHWTQGVPHNLPTFMDRPSSSSLALLEPVSVQASFLA